MAKNVNILFVVLLAISLAPFGFSQEKSKAPKSQTANLQMTQCALKVSGMTCSGCAGIVKKGLQKVEGVKTATVDHKTGDVQVEYDSSKTNPDKIVDAFNKANPGFRAEVPKPKGS